MGVAHKMSSDERSQPSVVSAIKLKRGNASEGPASTGSDENEPGNSNEDRTPSPDFPVFTSANEPENPKEPTSEAKRRRGRPPKKSVEASSVPNTPEDSRQSLTESEAMDVSEVVGDGALPKRVRNKPKRFASEETDASKPSPDSAPAKRRRGRPPKNDFAGTPTGTPSRDAADASQCDAYKDPLEEDLSESSSDVIPERWAKSTTILPPDASPAASSASDSPLRVPALSASKRSRGRPKNTTVVTEKISSPALTNLQVKCYSCRGFASRSQTHNFFS